MVSLWRRVVRFLGAAGLALLVLTANDGRAQTTTGTAATGNTLFNATFNCLSMGCHSASTANRFNAINAGGHISYANSQGMGGTAGTAQQYADIGAYLATLFTGLAAQSVTFGVAKNIAIPNIALATSYGDYVALRTVSGFAPTSGSVSYSGTTATYTPNANDCGSDTFRYEAYRSVANGSGTSNARTVSLTITNPSLPVINSASIKNSTVGVATSYHHHHRWNSWLLRCKQFSDRTLAFIQCYIGSADHRRHVQRNGLCLQLFERKLDRPIR